VSDWPVIAARFALYGDLTLFFGMSLFGLYGLRGAERRDNGLLPFRPLVSVLAIAGITLSAIGFVAMAAAMAGTGLLQVGTSTLTMLLAQTAVGTAVQVRTAALAVCLLAGCLLRRRPAAALGTIAMMAGIALASLAWSGHGAATEGRAGMIHIGADILHLLTAGAWIGALFSLLLLAARTAPKDAAAHVRTLHRALDGFSGIGTVIVGLIIVTGLVNGLFLVGVDQVMDLPNSLWGQLMLAKIVLFLGMLALAAANRFRLTPDLERAMERRDHARALAALRRSLKLETTAAAVILGLVAWLGTLEPVATG
jgi:putative copper resistance protein D